MRTVKVKMVRMLDWVKYVITYFYDHKYTMLITHRKLFIMYQIILIIINIINIIILAFVTIRNLLNKYH